MSNLYPVGQINGNLKKFCKLLNRFQLEKNSKTKSKLYRKLKRFLSNHPEVVSIMSRYELSKKECVNDFDNASLYPGLRITMVMVLLLDDTYKQVEIKDDIQKEFSDIELKNIIYGLCPPGITYCYSTVTPVNNNTRLMTTDDVKKRFDTMYNLKGWGVISNEKG